MNTESKVEPGILPRDCFVQWRQSEEEREKLETPTSKLQRSFKSQIPKCNMNSHALFCSWEAISDSEEVVWKWAAQRSTWTGSAVLGRPSLPTSRKTADAVQTLPPARVHAAEAVLMRVGPPPKIFVMHVLWLA